MNLNQVTLPARDLAASAAFYRRMGFLQIVDSPHYARFECTEGEATFSLHAVDGHAVDGRAVDGHVVDDHAAGQASADQTGDQAGDHGYQVYFEHDDLDALVARLQAAGFVFDSLPQDQRWLWREARLRDPSGNMICLYRAGEMRRHPPWRVERRADDAA